jgi:hypothetical protein
MMKNSQTEIKTLQKIFNANRMVRISNLLNEAESYSNKILDIDGNFKNTYIFVCKPENCFELNRLLHENRDFIIENIHFLNREIENFAVEAKKENIDEDISTSEQDDQKIPLLKDYLLKYLQQREEEYKNYYGHFKNCIIYHETKFNSDDFGNEWETDEIIIEVSPESIACFPKISVIEENISIILRNIIPKRWNWNVWNAKVSTYSTLENELDLPGSEAENKFTEWLNQQQYKFFNISQSPEHFPENFRKMGLKRPDFYIIDLDIYIDVKSRSFNRKYKNVTLSTEEYQKFTRLRKELKNDIYFAFSFKDIEFSTWYWISLTKIGTKPDRQSINGYFRSIPIDECIPIGNESLKERLNLTLNK